MVEPGNAVQRVTREVLGQRAAAEGRPGIHALAPPFVRGLAGAAGGRADLVPGGAAFAFRDHRVLHELLGVPGESQGGTEQLAGGGVRGDGDLCQGALGESEGVGGVDEAGLVARGELPGGPALLGSGGEGDVGHGRQGNPDGSRLSGMP